MTRLTRDRGNPKGCAIGVLLCALLVLLAWTAALCVLRLLRQVPGICASLRVQPQVALRPMPVSGH